MAVVLQARLNSFTGASLGWLMDFWDQRISRDSEPGWRWCFPSVGFLQCYDVYLVRVRYALYVEWHYFQLFVTWSRVQGRALFIFWIYWAPSSRNTDLFRLVDVRASIVHLFIDFHNGVGVGPGVGKPSLGTGVGSLFVWLLIFDRSSIVELGSLRCSSPGTTDILDIRALPDTDFNTEVRYMFRKFRKYGNPMIRPHSNIDWFWLKFLAEI